MESQILIKATELLSYIQSFGKINKLAEPIKEELENGQIIPIHYEPDEYYSFCHGIIIYGRMENLTIELAILLRRLCETSYKNIDEIVKYKTPGRVFKTGKSQTFKQVLNKIIHSIAIQYEVNDGENSTFSYLYGQDISFTGNMYVQTDGKSQYIINMVEVCLNAFVLSSIDK